MEKRNKFFAVMSAMVLMFSLALIGCPVDSDDDGGEISKLLGTWENDTSKWVITDEIAELWTYKNARRYTDAVGIKSYDGTTLTFYDGSSCTAAIAGNVLTVSGYENLGRKMNGKFTKK
jgi:hypothetical protein